MLGAPGADLILLPVRPELDTVWVAIDAADLRIIPLDGLDLTRQLGRVEADGVIVPASRQLRGRLWDDFSFATTIAAVILSAEAVGIAGWAVHTATEYAKIRHQFGRPIGQFQAVKHRCARMLVALEQAAAAVWDAARALDELASPDESSAPSNAGHEFAAAVAAALAASAAVSCTHECIQVLGGIGFTWEHDAHLYYRRALTIQALLSSDTGPRHVGERGRCLAPCMGFTRPVRLELPGGDEDLRTSHPGRAGRDRPAGREGAQRRARGRRLGDAAPAQALGPRRGRTGATGHRGGTAGREYPGARARDRRVGRARPDPVRHAGAAGAVPAGHAAGWTTCGVSCSASPAPDPTWPA